MANEASEQSKASEAATRGAPGSDEATPSGLAKQNATPADIEKIAGTLRANWPDALAMELKKPGGREALRQFVERAPEEAVGLAERLCGRGDTEGAESLAEAGVPAREVFARAALAIKTTQTPEKKKKLLDFIHSPLAEAAAAPVEPNSWAHRSTPPIATLIEHCPDLGLGAKIASWGGAFADTPKADALRTMAEALGAASMFCPPRQDGDGRWHPRADEPAMALFTLAIEAMGKEDASRLRAQAERLALGWLGETRSGERANEASTAFGSLLAARQAAKVSGAQNNFWQALALDELASRGLLCAPILARAIELGEKIDAPLAKTKALAERDALFAAAKRARKASEPQFAPDVPQTEHSQSQDGKAEGSSPQAEKTQDASAGQGSGAPHAAPGRRL
jgi:hypothetical protein